MPQLTSSLLSFTPPPPSASVLNKRWSMSTSATASLRCRISASSSTGTLPRSLLHQQRVSQPGPAHLCPLTMLALHCPAVVPSSAACSQSCQNSSQLQPEARSRSQPEANLMHRLTTFLTTLIRLLMLTCQLSLSASECQLHLSASQWQLSLAAS